VTYTGIVAQNLGRQHLSSKLPLLGMTYIGHKGFSLEVAVEAKAAQVLQLFALNLR
jgi:hypothetical protein